MMTVFATREGLPGDETTSGYHIDAHVAFVALPSLRACHDRRSVRVRNPKTGTVCIAQVLDVGPHSDNDDEYVYGGQRPLAERGISRVKGIDRESKNRAGIDLGEWVWARLGMTDNGPVDWEFVE